MLRGNATTGGSDMLGESLHHQIRSVSVGRLIQIIDGIIVFAGLLTFGVEHTLFLYANKVAAYAGRQSVDALLYRFGTRTDNGEDDILHRVAGLDRDGHIAAVPKRILFVIRIDELVREHGYRYRDIVILMPEVSTDGPKLAELLRERGIGIFFDGKGSFFEQHEIIIFRNLLMLLDNPRLDLPLLTVLVNPPFDYTEEELVKILEGMVTKSGFEITPEAIEKVKKIIQDNKDKPNFGNARFIRNLFEKSIILHATNTKDKKSKKILRTLTEKDINIDNLLV